MTEKDRGLRHEAPAAIVSVEALGAEILAGYRKDKPLILLEHEASDKESYNSLSVIFTRWPWQGSFELVSRIFGAEHKTFMERSGLPTRRRALNDFLSRFDERLKTWQNKEERYCLSSLERGFPSIASAAAVSWEGATHEAGEARERLKKKLPIDFPIAAELARQAREKKTLGEFTLAFVPVQRKTTLVLRCTGENTMDRETFNNLYEHFARLTGFALDVILKSEPTAQREFVLEPRLNP